MDNLIELSQLSQLTESELTETNGGKTPSESTSAANDLAYYTVYAARAIWDGFSAFIDGARSGSKYFYK